MPKEKYHIGCLLALAVFLTCLAVLFIRGTMGSNRSAHAVVCLSNVRQLGHACKMYSIDHDERFPDSFLVLFDYRSDYRIDSQSFFCPGVYGRRLPENTNTFDEASISYKLIPGLCESDETPEKTILVSDKSAWNHGGGGVNVFYIDGHASFIKVDKMVEADFDTISGGLSSFFEEKGRYPTNEESLEILVASGYLKNVPVDTFDKDGKRPYGYATKNVRNNWILSSYGPDEDTDIDLKLYSTGQLPTEKLLRLRAKLVLGMLIVRRTNGDIFRVGP